MTRRYVYLPEAADYLGMTVTALRSKVQRRELTFIKDGRRLKFDKTDLDAYMHAHKIEAES